MKTLIYGAGPLGTLYAHRLVQQMSQVTPDPRAPDFVLCTVNTELF